MLSYKIIHQKDKELNGIYYSATGEVFYLDAKWGSLELPFYAVIGKPKLRKIEHTWHNTDRSITFPWGFRTDHAIEIDIAFQEKEELIEWAKIPLTKAVMRIYHKGEQ